MSRGEGAISKYLAARWNGGARVHQWKASARRLRSSGSKADDNYTNTESGSWRNAASRRGVRGAFIAVMIGLLGLAVWQFSGPANGTAQARLLSRRHSPTIANPAPTPAVANGGVPIAYQGLLSHSLFAIGGLRAGQSADASPQASAGFSLKGISQEDASYTAYVEDTAAKRVIPVRVGDLLASGRVCDINLHNIAYEVAGRVLRVDVGKTLDGAAAQPMPTSVAIAIPQAPLPKPQLAGGHSTRNRQGWIPGEARASTAETH